MAVSGRQVAVASACDVRTFSVGGQPRLLKRFGFCREDEGDSAVIGLWLGRRTVVEETVISPSPHGDGYELWAGPLGGALRQIGGQWGWTDSDEPPTYGCDWSVAAGAGVVAMTRIPNTAGDGLSCTGIASSKILLRGAVARDVTVAGSWSVLATDGKRIALAALDAKGNPTGRLQVVGTDGKPRSTPMFRTADIKGAYTGWFTERGLFLYAKRGVVGPGSTLLARVGESPTVAEGRLLYLRGRAVRARRLRGGPDRLIVRLPDAYAQIAAGTYGLLAMTGAISSRTAVYRIPWSTIDRVVPR